MTDERDRPDEVGFKQPPRATQFKPGKSGNPKGRPKGSKNFVTVIQDELKTTVRTTENGKRKKISKRQAVAKQLVNTAASGDFKAIPILLNEIRPYENQAGPDQSEFVREDDRMVMDSIVKRIRESAAPPTSSDVPVEPSTDSALESKPTIKSEDQQ